MVLYSGDTKQTERGCSPVSVKNKNAQEEFKQLFDRHYTYVYKFCLSRLPQDRAYAEDCTQEAFLVLYKRLQAGEEIEHPFAFLLQTARNFVLKRVREIERRQDEIDINDIVHMPAQNDDIDDRLTFEEYTRQISDALSDREAEAFKLRYIDELDADKIAEIQNRSIGSVYTDLSRIREKLRKIFPKDYFSS